MSRLESVIFSALGVRVCLAWSALPAPASSLSCRETARSYGIRPGQARDDWLKGRAALKALLGPGFDTSSLAFPHPSLSLSHAGGVAVAVRAWGGSVSGLAGIGIDFEPLRAAVRVGVGRFFLSPAEQAAAVGAKALMRAWTVKEALYKATPGNESCVLADFELVDPTAERGEVVGPGGESLRYVAVDIGGAGRSGHLALAVCLRRSHVTV